MNQVPRTKRLAWAIILMAVIAISHVGASNFLIWLSDLDPQMIQ